MLRENDSILNEISQAFDIGFLSLSFYLTIELYHYKEAATHEKWLLYFIVLLVYVFWWFIFSKINHIYHSRRFMTAFFEVKQLSKAHVLSFLFTLMSIEIYQHALLHNRFLFYFEAIALLISIFTHLVVRQLLESFRRMGRNSKYVLLIGSGNASHAYLNKVKQHPQLGFKVIGYLAPKANGLEIPYLGNYSQLEKVIHSNIVDVTVVTAPISDNDVKECLVQLEIMGKTVNILLDDIVTKVIRSRPVNFDGLNMVAYDNRPRSFELELIKRILDITLSGLGLIVLSPILLIVALIIKLTSKGPVFFIQDRAGLNGRTFKMIKFRSMVINAEELKEKLAHLNEMSGPVFKIANDPRVTPVGRFIRKTSIDELPQLWNVFTGSMSLVGPRPPLSKEVDMYNTKHRKRLSVKPGITCIWQVSGRNNVDFDEWMAMDAEYVDTLSLWLDIKLLAKTLPAVLFRKGSS